MRVQGQFGPHVEVIYADFGNAIHSPQFFVVADSNVRVR